MTLAHPKEGDVKDKAKKLLTKYGWFFWMPAANAFGQSGISDILALKGGRFLAVEVKLKKKSGSPLQERFMEQVREAGGWTYLVNMENLPDFEAALQSFETMS